MSEKGGLPEESVLQSYHNDIISLDLVIGISSDCVLASDLGQVEIPCELFEGDIEQRRMKLYQHLIEIIKHRVRQKKEEPLEELATKKVHYYDLGVLVLSYDPVLSDDLGVFLGGPQYHISVIPNGGRMGVLPDLDRRELHLYQSTWDYLPIVGLGKVIVPNIVLDQDAHERIKTEHREAYEANGYLVNNGELFPLERYLMRTIKERVESLEFHIQ